TRSSSASSIACAAAPIPAASASSSTIRRMDAAGGATWPPAAIAPRPRVTGRSSRRIESGLSPVTEVVRTYLELRTPEQLRPARFDDPAVRVVRRSGIDVHHYRRLYETVGAQWHWIDRNAWSDDKLRDYLARPNVSVWECLAGDQGTESAGYFELDVRDD